MKTALLSLDLLMFYFFIIIFLDGFSHYQWMRCHTNSMDLSDMVFIDTFYFNGMKYLVFNSTIGKYVGYSEVGLRIADSWNSNEFVLNRELNAVDGYCKTSAAFYKGLGMNVTCKYYHLIKISTMP